MWRVRFRRFFERVVRCWLCRYVSVCLVVMVLYVACAFANWQEVGKVNCDQFPKPGQIVTLVPWRARFNEFQRVHNVCRVLLQAVTQKMK